MTLKETLFRAYANLGMAVFAVKNGEKEYSKLAYGIRKKTLDGLMNGTSQIRSLFRDERLKMELPECCWYCGEKEDLTLDHMLAVKKGGQDTGDNFVYACRKCNSSKNADDLMKWYAQNGKFPPLYILQRYLKLAIRFSEENGLMDLESDAVEIPMPFELEYLPEKFPAPGELLLFVPEKKSEPEKRNELKGRTYVFTGELDKMTRAEACAIVKEMGAETRGGVTSMTTHLVVGQKLWESFRKCEKTTNKLTAARKLQMEEHPIQIVPEVRFLTQVLQILLRR